MILADLSNTLIGFAALAVVIVLLAIIFKLKQGPTEADKNKAEEFLKGLSDTFYSKMVDIVTTLKPEDFGDIEEFESEILSEIYNTLWDYTEAEMKKAAGSDLLTAMVIQVIDREFVNDFVNSVIASSDIKSMINDIWLKYFENRVKELEAQEDVVYGIDENGNKVPLTGPDYIEDGDDNDLPPVDESTKDLFADDYIAPIKPQSDNEEEEVTDDTSDIYIDAKGRKHSKKTGRFI